MAALAQVLPIKSEPGYVSKYPDRKPLPFNFGSLTMEQLVELELIVSDTFYDLVDMEKDVEFMKAITPPEAAFKACSLNRTRIGDGRIRDRAGRVLGDRTIASTIVDALTSRFPRKALSQAQLTSEE